ncbi:diguanylate cyclase [Moorena producens PAL-8-15-08-1]|uniref:histidine kinase n=2 Tax=Moorena TaxID=1155738 RepID=A0A1D8TYX4_9CYAN|nr:diguanylate cyclase [Moorena producens PAL-8-15-08-1]
MLPEHAPMESSTGHQRVDYYLLKVQAEMINQIAQVTRRTLVLNELLPTIANQLRQILQVSGCLMFPTHDPPAMATHQVSFPITQSLHSTAEPCLIEVFRHLFETYHSWLAQGKPLIIPESEGKLPPELKELTYPCDIRAIMMVPLLHGQSCLGSMTLYQCDHEREWTVQEIAFIQGIADHFAIALTHQELEQLYQKQSQELKQKESALKVSEARNRALLEAIPDVIFRVNRDGFYLDWKAAIENPVLFLSNNCIGKHLHNCLPTEVAGLIWEHVEIALESDEMQVIESPVRQDGKLRYFEARIVKSGLDEVAVIVQDITERIEARLTLAQVNDALEVRVQQRTAALRKANQALKGEIIERQKAEEQLRQSEERFRNVVEISSNWMWEMDENAVYTYASPKVWDLLGYEPSEVVGKTPFDLMSQEEAKRVMEILASFTVLKHPFSNLENTRIHKNSQSVVLETSGVPIFDRLGKFCGYRGVDRDITKRKQTELEIINALAKEKQLGELKSRFITMTSHEFRTPLTTIFSSAELLEHYGNKWSDCKKNNHLNRIQKMVKHMTRLLNDILLIGNVESGKIELNLNPIDLAKFCTDLINEIQLYDRNNHIINFIYNLEKFGYKLGSNHEKNNAASSLSSTRLYMDEKLLRQILENLLSNALKYSPNGSTVELQLTCSANQAIFKISDQGIGIPEEDQGLLFETFHRGTNVGTITGTGLGLTIVKKCLDIYQGQIDIESEVTVGTTFTVTLPIYYLLSN